MHPDRVMCSEPNYKEEYYRLQEELHQLKMENEKLKNAVINLALKI